MMMKFETNRHKNQQNMSKFSTKSNSSSKTTTAINQRQQQKKHYLNKRLSSLSMMAIFSLFFIIFIFDLTFSVSNVSARYLPTRSNNDQLRRQEIKEILRLLLELPNDLDQPQSSSSPQFESTSYENANNGLGAARIRVARHLNEQPSSLVIHTSDPAYRASLDKQRPLLASSF